MPAIEILIFSFCTGLAFMIGIKLYKAALELTRR